MIFGIAYLGAGVLGLIPAMMTPPPADAPGTAFTVMYGYLLGLFPVNILHTAVHFVIGLWGIAAWSGAAAAGVFARSLAVLYGVLAVMGLVPGLDTAFGMIPLHGHDVWLHAGTAAFAAYFGWWASVASVERRHGVERRQRMMPTGRERRLAFAERRHGYGGMHPA